MTAESRPTGMSLAALALLGQACVLALLAVWAGVLGVDAKPHDRISDGLLALVAAAAGGALFLVGRGLSAGSRWARAPAMVWELIMLPVGVSLAQGIPIAGALLLASAVVVLVGIIAGQGAAA